jgi:mono/diheme cytochrome c family protein
MASAAPALPAGVTPQLIAQGDSLFAARSCARCHGAAGVGGQNGPSLVAGAWLHGGRDYTNLVRIITNGMPRDSVKDATRRFAMNPRGGGQTLLTDDQIRAVAAYVWSISSAKAAQ